MDNKIAVIGIIIENYDNAQFVNGILHTFGEHIIGRMGLPYRQGKVNVISVVVDCPVAITNAITGKLGMLDGVSAKAVFSKK